MINELNYHDNYCNCASHKHCLTEVTRWEMINSGKTKSPDRFLKSKNYSPKDFKNVDFEDLFVNDTFTWSTRVYGEEHYIVTISFEGPFDYLKDTLKGMRGKNRYKRITVDLLAKALSVCLDTEDLFVDCSCPDFCLTEDTEIKLLNGEVLPIKDILTKFNNNEELWVYSTDENGDFKPGKVTDVWVSGQTKELIKVTLDNGKEITTTPTHRYMLRDGGYIPANELSVGQSLMPLYFSYHNGYESVKLNSKPKSFVSVYKTIANELLQNEIAEAKIRSNEDIIAIHHKDFNKLNNYPSNLSPMGKLEHWYYHCKHTKDNPEQLNKFIKAGQDYWRTPDGRQQKSQEMARTMRKYWDSMSDEDRAEHNIHSHLWQKTEDGHTKLSNAKKKYWAELDIDTKKARGKIFSDLVNSGNKSSERIKNYWNSMTPEEYQAKCKRMREIAKAHPITVTENMRKVRSENGKKIGPSNLNKLRLKQINTILQLLIDNKVIINEENYEKFRPSGYPHYYIAVQLGALEKYNHKVKSIEHIVLEKSANVYDLTVDNYNNFYVNAGIILHNCYRFAYWATQADCKYGTPQNRAPTVRNVKNNKGYVCKHILAILYGKRWVQSAARAWYEYVQANPELSEYYIWGEPKIRNNNNNNNKNNSNNLNNSDDYDDDYYDEDEVELPWAH